MTKRAFREDSDAENDQTTNNWSQTIIRVVPVMMILLVMENYCRNDEDWKNSNFRPSIGLNWLAINAKFWFQWAGFQFAKLTDVFYWIYEYLMEDLVNILRPLGQLIFSWLQFFKGYFDYFLSAVTWTNWPLGMIGTGGLLVGITGICHQYTGYPQIGWVINFLNWVRGTRDTP